LSHAFRYFWDEQEIGEAQVFDVRRRINARASGGSSRDPRQAVLRLVARSRYASPCSTAPRPDGSQVR
jgi:hypothetical protein